MSFTLWLAEKLGMNRQARADKALDLTEDIILHTRSVREQLEPYCDSADPLSAIKEAKKAESASWRRSNLNGSAVPRVR